MNCNRILGITAAHPQAMGSDEGSTNAAPVGPGEWRIAGVLLSFPMRATSYHVDCFQSSF